MLRPVDVRQLKDPYDILYTVNGKGKTLAELVEHCGGGERGETTAARMIATGIVRELPGAPGEYVATQLGRWFYSYIDCMN